MRAAIVSLCLLAVVAAPAAAQVPREPAASGYLFVAPGAISVNVSQWTRSALHLGAGYEHRVFKGLAFAIDGGPLRVDDQWTGEFNLNALYQFGLGSQPRLRLFVIGGLTALPAFDVGGGIDFGGGLIYWVGKRNGLRFEVRDQARPGKLHTYHDAQVRVGVTLR